MKQFLIFLLTLQSVLAFSQGHSVDLATGTLNVTVPLYTISDGDVSVPIIFNYNANGVRVTDDDGWVGHNWSLSAQSYQVSREVRGLPDDYKSGSGSTQFKGWIKSNVATAVKNFVQSSDNNPATCTDEVPNYNFLNGINFRRDTEPDAFYVNAPGLSFQFYFDENRQPQVVPYADVLITMDSTGGQLKSFSVTDENGIQYKFEEVETATEYITKLNPYYLVRKTNQWYASNSSTAISYNASWKLTKVISPIYGTITLTYRSVNSLNTPYVLNNKATVSGYFRFLDKINFTTGVNDGSVIFSRNFVFKVLSKVSSPLLEAEFVSAPKSQSTVMERLNKIKVFDKRTGIPILTREVDLVYNITAYERAFLIEVKERAMPSTDSRSHLFSYITPEKLQSQASGSTDDWEFYKESYSPTIPYEESLEAGTLRKVTYPLGGYSAFFFEPHDFLDGVATITGGGIRVKKVITSYGGTDDKEDLIEEYAYKTTGGTTSGKLQKKGFEKFPVVKLDYFKHDANSSHIWGARYRDLALAYPSENFASWFKINPDEELYHTRYFHGSAVAYTTVTVTKRNEGRTVFEFDLPASYGETSVGTEWEASKVSIARPSTGVGGCFASDNLILEGYNSYPFPPNPDYDFAKGLLKKKIGYDELGNKVSESLYDYQRIYGGSGIKKIFGLAVEELPTYYYNTGTSSYIDSKLFLYSKYPIYTDVSTVITKQTEVIYHTTDLAKKTESITEFFYGNAAHRRLIRTETSNSDQTKTVKRWKYVSDYVFNTPTNDTQLNAFSTLTSAHCNNTVVESTISEMNGGVESFLSGRLTTFTGKLPSRMYVFSSPEGLPFSLSSVDVSNASNHTFKYETSKYSLDINVLSRDIYGNVIESEGRDKSLSSVSYGYNGSSPILVASNARLSTMIYTDFDTQVAPRALSVNWPSPVYTLDRNGGKAVTLPANTSSQYAFSYGLNTDGAKSYTFSCWLKSSSTGTLRFEVSTSTTTTYTIDFPSSSEWKFYAVQLPNTPASFSMFIKSNVAVEIDDILLYPDYADVKVYNYKPPHGVVYEIDGRGNYYHFKHDDWGRVLRVFDRNKNVIKANEYR